MYKHHFGHGDHAMVGSALVLAGKIFGFACCHSNHLSLHGTR